MIRPADDVHCIRYFTAMVNGPTKPNQQVYLQALATTAPVEVILGNFKKKRVQCKVSACTYFGKKLFETQEEKRTDVNIAIYMLDDAYQDKCDKFVLVSGDSDLVPAVKMIRHRFPAKQIIIYVPAQHPARSHAVELRSSAHVNRNLPLNLLKHCQFANPLPDLAGGLLNKPASW
jgi:6-hydroxy-3-succinoylpyridine 3-monooxygenase